MNSIASLLPRSPGEWARLLKRALAIPPQRVVYPAHFQLRTVSGGYSVLPQHMKGRAELPVRNGVLVLFSPTSTTETGFQDMCITLTKRSSHLRSHKGEMSFPGGHLEAGESAVDAAQRETVEEVAVGPESYTVVGTLEPLESRRDSGIVAVLAVSDEAVCPQCASLDEVESIHYLHLSSLLTRSAETHCCATRLSQTAGNQLLHFPCFFASSSQDTVSPAATPPSPGAARLASDGALAPLLVSDYPGELVWGLTAILLCEILARIATQIEMENPTLTTAAVTSVLQCSNIVARSPYPTQ